MWWRCVPSQDTASLQQPQVGGTTSKNILIYGTRPLVQRRILQDNLSMCADITIIKKKIVLLISQGCLHYLHLLVISNTPKITPNPRLCL